MHCLCAYVSKGKKKDNEVSHKADQTVHVPLALSPLTMLAEQKECLVDLLLRKNQIMF
jgi:hypothetical protein